MFDLVLTMSVGVLLGLGGAIKKNRLRKKKVEFLKVLKLIRADKKKVIVVTQLLSAQISF